MLQNQNRTSNASASNDMDDLLNSFQTKMVISKSKSKRVVDETTAPVVEETPKQVTKRRAPSKKSTASSDAAPSNADIAVASDVKTKKPRKKTSSVPAPVNTSASDAAASAGDIEDENLDDVDEISKLKICSQLEDAELAAAASAANEDEFCKTTSCHLTDDDDGYGMGMSMDKDFADEMDRFTQTFQQTILNECMKESETPTQQRPDVLSHLGNYVEEPYAVIESYFEGQHLERLVRHQIESYNHFINYQIQKTIDMFNPVTIRSEHDYIPETKLYVLEIVLSFENFKLYPPQIHENNGATKMMLPQESRLRNFTYASTMTVDIRIDYIIRNQEDMEHPKIIQKVLPKINIGKMPIMVKSSVCILNQYRHVHPLYTGECHMDCGGYFIIKGSEKTVLGQERAAENRVYCFDGKNTTKWSWFAEIKSIPDYKCISPKQIEMMIASKSNGFGNGIYVTVPRIKQPIELFVLFRALGIISDKEICEYILLDVDDEKNEELLQALQASIFDANKYMTREDAMRHITSMVAYMPMNMDKETGAKKKREFTQEVLDNDLFPHCATLPQKIYLLGYMAKKLLLTSKGWLPPDDRDSYVNKRIELTGTLLNNLFRNYFNKLVKEMQKQVIREINMGSWRSTEDFENIINMTNIYKIMKSTTIENGINRALATGDFSIKQSNSSKVGVAQVLNRLTYVASLSHLRRINTPLEKSGELVAPRKLHNTTWGFLCLTGDTEILMSDRMTTKKIKDLRDGDCVTTIHPKTLAHEPSEIHSFFSKMPDRLFEITTESGRKIKATANHPFLINVDGKPVWKNLEDLTPGVDEVIIRPTVTHIRDEITSFVKLRETDVLKQYRQELLDKNLLNINIPTYKLKMIARLLGALSRNGSLTERIQKTQSSDSDAVSIPDKKYYYISIYLQEKRDVLQLLNDIYGLQFGTATVSCTSVTEDTPCPWLIQIDGCLAYLMRAMGGNILTEKNQSIPYWLSSVGLSVKREFLSGFQCMDGLYLAYSTSKKTWKPSIKNISQITPNNRLYQTVNYMTQIANLYMEFDIKTNIKVMVVNECISKVCMVFRNTLENLEKCADTLSYPYCEKSRVLSAPILENIKIKKYRNSTSDNLPPYTPYHITTTSLQTNLLDQGCVSVTIASIQEIPPEPVYDFTTRSDNHSFVASSFVSHNCPAETPEGQSIGVVKNISYLAHITIPTNSVALREYVSVLITPIESIKNPKELYEKVKVFVNGSWVGVTENPIELYNDIKEKKYKGIINIYTSIVFDYKKSEIRICNDGGRLTRPVLRVKDNKAIITQDVIQKLVSKEICWNDLLISCRLDESVIEYIDPEEQNYAMIAMKAKDSYLLQDEHFRYNYTHCEIHPSTIFGILASCIPFPEHNQAPRNTYQTAMAKQAMGVYSTNYDHRMDKTSYVLNYPSRPLVETRVMNFLHLNNIPSGSQIHVAIMTHTGYNQEDSVLINKGSIDRGLFLATIYHTEKDEDKNIIRDEIIRCKPDKTKTKGIKYGNYEKLNAQGFIQENHLVENRDVIIAKIVPIKENRNDPTKIIKYEDQSKIFSTTEETYVDKNYTSRNGDGYNFAKVRVRILRKPVMGDKMCALPTQQVLTDAGWMEIQDIDIQKHRVCTLDANGKMCYEFPTAKFEYDHDWQTDGPLWHFSNKQLEMTCTTNHKLYVQKRGQSEYKLVETSDIMSTFDEAGEEIVKRGTQWRFQKAMENVYSDVPTITIGEAEYEMDVWIQLVGMFISDGSTDKHTNGVYITALKQRKIEFNTMIFEKLGVNFSYHKDGNFYISGCKYPDIYNHLSELSLGALNKRLPDYVWNLSQRQSRILLEALMQGDGSTMKYKGEDSFSRYGTISIQLANDISRLAVHCGYSAIIKLAEEPTGVARMGVRNIGSRAGQVVSITQKHTYYKVSIITKQNQPFINKKTNDSNVEKLIQYTGKVYCIEAPSSHVYYMRESLHSPSLIVGNSSRHGQKGTVGNIVPEKDMPFTKDGLRPDVIINPHAIPSRMTIAQLKETLLGKVLLELGMFGDGTSFGNLEVKDIARELQRIGYESYGNEVMYNGLTGEQLETSIFIGPVFYQRLKHMVNDKQHSRSIGPMVNLTRQPAEGRSKQGGFRIGEMERDVMIAHGAARLCRERLYDVSDKYSVHVCKKCGITAAYNDGDQRKLYSDFSIHLCKMCGNNTDFAKVDIPYAFKLLSQELQTINVVPRLITE
jgi:DNA-directed RNA polymerase beta subunit